AHNFVNDFVRFSHGKVVGDDQHADAGEIGRAGQTYRRIRLESLFGNMQVMVTDGHLPYPFGHEVTGYQVKDLGTTLEKAKGAGAKLLSPPYTTNDRITAIVEFPGGYIAEMHSLAPGISH
ncbi:MAG: glyoxalase, partial [Terriglobales bacterium]